MERVNLNTPPPVSSPPTPATEATTAAATDSESKYQREERGKLGVGPDMAAALRLLGVAVRMAPDDASLRYAYRSQGMHTGWMNNTCQAL